VEGSKIPARDLWGHGRSQTCTRGQLLLLEAEKIRGSLQSPASKYVNLYEYVPVLVIEKLSAIYVVEVLFWAFL